MNPPPHPTITPKRVFYCCLFAVSQKSTTPNLCDVIYEWSIIFLLGFKPNFEQCDCQHDGSNIVDDTTSNNGRYERSFCERRYHVSYGINAKIMTANHERSLCKRRYHVSYVVRSKRRRMLF